MKPPPPIKALMTTFPFSIRERESVAQTRKMMAAHQIRHLPVKNGEGELWGVISERDVELGLVLKAGSSAGRARFRFGKLDAEAPQRWI